MKTRIEDVLIEWTPSLPNQCTHAFVLCRTTLRIALRLGIPMQIVPSILSRIRAELDPQYAVELSIDMVPTPREEVLSCQR